MNKEMLDIYSDYLISSFSYTTATGLSRMLDNAVSHDKITRFLSKREYTSKDLWQQVKPTVRQIETESGIISIDDTIEEKPYTDENDIICWHYDHSAGRTVKGVNILNCIYTNDTANIPLAFEIIKKDQIVTDEKTGKQKRQSSVTKNELMRKMIKTCVHNRVKFKYVLSDIWFSAKDKDKVKKGFHLCHQRK
jgi:SRSO17 transposase